MSTLHPADADVTPAQAQELALLQPRPRADRLLWRDVQLVHDPRQELTTSDD